jgi:hypothetical protein
MTSFDVVRDVRNSGKNRFVYSTVGGDRPDLVTSTSSEDGLDWFWTELDSLLRCTH